MSAAEQAVRDLADRIAKEVGAQPADVYVVACIEVALRVMRQSADSPTELQAIERLLDVLQKMKEKATS